MKNLKVWQKLGLLVLMFMVPFALVTNTLVTTIDRLGTDVAAKEGRGLDYQVALLTLLKNLQLHRGLTGAALAGDASFKDRAASLRADIERNLAVVDQIDQRADAELHTTGKWSALKGNCVALLSEAADATADDSFRRHTKAIEDTLTLMVDVSDASGLTLDPAPDSYYLMVASMVQGPQLTEALAQARGLGVQIMGGHAPADVAARLKDAVARAEYLGEHFGQSLNKAIASNPDLQPTLQVQATAADAAVHDSAGSARLLTGNAPRFGTADDYFVGVTSSIDQVFDGNVAIITALGELLNKRVGAFQREIMRTLAIATVGFLAVLLIAFFIIRDITQPLREVVHIANQISTGDVSIASSLERRRDEIGSMAQAFERMVAYLREMVFVSEQIAAGDLSVKVTPHSGQDLIGNSLAAMVHNLATLVGQVQKSGIQVASSVNEIAATAKQQQATAGEIAATTMEIGATSKEISATSRELVKTVGEVSKVADQSATLAGAGQAGLARMEESMRQVMEAAGTINSKLAVLSDKAGNISQVITTITKVADQTNLLSLNAAIEAEKAGEYGRGFSVVATEIRRLADQTAVATFDIEQMVKEIQSAVAAGVMGMDTFSEEVRRGMSDVGQVGTQLSQIIHQVQTLAPRFESVNEGMQAQSTGAEQITQALTQLNEAAQQTVESLRQSSQAIDGLNDAATGLRTGVSQFRLAD